MAGPVQEAVTFEDVAVYLSRAEWEMVAEEQRELYRSVMADNYELLASLGYPGPKPDVLHRLERGEEPWVSAPQSPETWDGASSPSPGCTRDEQWLAEPCSSWWPGADSHRALEETQTPSHAGERCEPWRLRSSRLLRKFGCPEGRGELQSEAAGSQAVPEGSQDNAQMDSSTGEEETEDEQGVRTELTQSMGNAASWERLHGDHVQTSQERAQETQRTLEEVSVIQANGEQPVEDPNETVLKDHCYCVNSAAHHTLLPRSLREHDYCRISESGASALRDHEYCQVQGFPYQDEDGEVACPACVARAMAYRLARRKSYVRRLIRKVKRTVRLMNPAFKSVRFTRAFFCTKYFPAPAASSSVPLVRAEDSIEESSWAFCLSAEQEAPSPQLGEEEEEEEEEEEDCQEETSEVLSAPAASLESAAASPLAIAAEEMQEEGVQPEEVVYHETQGEQVIHEADAQENTEECKRVNPNYVLLHSAFEVVVWTVDHMVESVCQVFELGGCSRCSKEMRSMITQMESSPPDHQQLPLLCPREEMEPCSKTSSGGLAGETERQTEGTSA